MRHQKKKTKLKNKEITNEGLRDLLGKVKNYFSGSGMSQEDTANRTNFVDRFVSSAISELTAAIEGEQVDPKARSSGAPASAAGSPAAGAVGSAPAGSPPAAGAAGRGGAAGAPAGSPPAAGAVGSAPAGSPPAAGAAGRGGAPAGAAVGAAGGRPQQAQVDVNMGKILTQMRGLQSGTKPLPAKMTQSLMKDIPNARYNKDWAINTGSKIIQFARAGYDVKQPYQAWMQANAIGKKQNTISEQSQNLSYYDKLNYLFESILAEISEAAAPPAGGAAPAPSGPAKMSISDFLFKNWWPSFMRGVRYDKNSLDPSFQQLFQEVESTYDKDKGKQALTKIAMRAYALQMDEVRRRSLAKAEGYDSVNAALAGSLDQLQRIDPNFHKTVMTAIEEKLKAARASRTAPTAPPTT